MEDVTEAIIHKMTRHRSEELERYKHFSPKFKQQTTELIAGKLIEELEGRKKSTKMDTVAENKKSTKTKVPKTLTIKILMTEKKGLEPATSNVTGQNSVSQISLKYRQNRHLEKHQQLRFGIVALFMRSFLGTFWARYELSDLKIFLTIISDHWEFKENLREWGNIYQHDFIFQHRRAVPDARWKMQHIACRSNPFFFTNRKQHTPLFDKRHLLMRMVVFGSDGARRKTQAANHYFITDYHLSLNPQQYFQSIFLPNRCVSESYC